MSEKFERKFILGFTKWVIVNVKFHKDRLSLTGQVSNEFGGIVCSGQILRSLIDGTISEWAEGWTPESARRLFNVWSRWHLNDLRAGSPAQEEFLREIKNSSKRQDWNDYTWRKERLSRAGLEPDKGHVVNGEPYSYGQSWLYEEVPHSIIEWLKNC